MIEITFGEWLKRQRSGRGLTQGQLAHQIGCAVVTLRKIEAEERRPSAQIIERLADIFDIPSNERTSFLRYARGDWAYAPAENGDETPWRASTSSPPTNLPAATTTFIGRETEQAEVMELLAKNRLVTLTGVGGIGKTRLSLQVGQTLLHNYPNGTWLVELAQLSNAALVPQTIVTALGLFEQADRAHLTLLTDFLWVKRALLILDGCEHLIQACAQLAESLLHACANLRILVTSREALSIAGEVIYRVPPLTTPEPLPAALDTISNYEAVKLFMERSQTALPDFSLRRDDASAIAQICSHLDGIPLALELAAARVTLLSVQEIAARLDNRFRLLTSGARTALPRHQTLQALIDWSYDLLSEAERACFCRLSIFAGGWTLEAAEIVCADVGQNAILPNHILDLLTQLVNKSLIGVERLQRQPTRYRMLETIRQYAHERLLEAAETVVRMRDQHLAYFLKKAEEIDDLFKKGQLEWLNYLDLELDNLRLALEWSISNRRGEQAFRLFGALQQFWMIRSHHLEGIEWFRQILELKEAASKPAQARAAKCAGILYWARGDFSSSRAQHKQSLDLYRELGDKQEISSGLQSLGLSEQSQGNFEQARLLFEESLSIGRAVNNKPAMMLALMSLGILSKGDGDYVTAAQQYEESLAICRQMQNSQQFLPLVLVNIGDLKLAQKDNAKARAYYGEALAIALSLKSKGDISGALMGLANVFCAEARYIRSARLCGFTVTLQNELGGLPIADAEDVNKIVAMLKINMGEDSYQKEFARGAALQLEQAIAFALEEQND